MRSGSRLHPVPTSPHVQPGTSQNRIDSPFLGDEGSNIRYGVAALYEKKNSRRQVDGLGRVDDNVRRSLCYNDIGTIHRDCCFHPCVIFWRLENSVSLATTSSRIHVVLDRHPVEPHGEVRLVVFHQIHLEQHKCRGFAIEIDYERGLSRRTIHHLLQRGRSF